MTKQTGQIEIGQTTVSQTGGMALPRNFFQNVMMTIVAGALMWLGVNFLQMKTDVEVIKVEMRAQAVVNEQTRMSQDEIREIGIIIARLEEQIKRDKKRYR